MGVGIPEQQNRFARLVVGITQSDHWLVNSFMIAIFEVSSLLIVDIQGIRI
jgi:hypothetical protein